MRLPRSRKKKTDEFVSLVDHAVRIVLAHKIVAVMIAFFVLAGSLFFFYSGKKKESALLGLNEKIYLTSQSDNPEKSLKEMEGQDASGWLAGWFLFQEYLAEGKTTEAFAQLELLGKKIPSFLKPLYVWNRASLLWEQGKGGEALAYLEQRADPSSLFNDHLLFLKGEILADLGKKEEAQIIFKDLAGDSSDERDPAVRKRAGQRIVLLNEK